MSHRIVFRDKKGVLKGPYSERTIQEWYRSGWFDRSFGFSFLSESEQFSDRTPVYSLGQLIDSNGFGCPFLGPPLKNRCEEQEEKLSRLEKEIVEVRSAIDSVPALKRRLEAIEKRIETLAKSRPTSNPAPKVTETGPSQRVREECEKLATIMAVCVLDVLDQLQSGEFRNERNGMLIVKHVRDFLASSDDATKRLASDLVLQKLQHSLECREFIYCSQCRSVAFNPRQVLMHIIGDAHAFAASRECNKSTGPTLLALHELVPTIYDWIMEDNDLYDSQHKDSDPGVMPTMAFWKQMQAMYGVPIAANVITELGTRDPTALQIAPKALTILKGDIGTRLLAQLDAHIVEGKAGCCYCGVVTGSRQAFYEHILSRSHAESMTKLIRFDVVTFAVNCHLKHLGKTTLI